MTFTSAARKYAEDSLPTITLMVCMLGLTIIVERLGLQGYLITSSGMALSLLSVMFMFRQKNIARHQFRHWDGTKLTALISGQNIVFALMNGICMTSIALSGITGLPGLAVFSALTASGMIVFWVNVIHASAGEVMPAEYA